MREIRNVSKPRSLRRRAVAKMSLLAKARCFTEEPKLWGMKRPASVRRFSALFSVRRSVPSPVSITWLRTNQPCRIHDVDHRQFAALEN